MLNNCYIKCWVYPVCSLQLVKTSQVLQGSLGRLYRMGFNVPINNETDRNISHSPLESLVHAYIHVVNKEKAL